MEEEARDEDDRLALEVPRQQPKGLQLETATIRDWEPLRTNLSLGNPHLRHWLRGIGLLLVPLVMYFVVKFVHLIGR